MQNTRHKTARLKKAFLAAYAETANITYSADAAKVDRRTHYKWLESDEEYACEFSYAGEQATDLLELEARRRAAEGLNEPVIHQGKLMGAWVNGDGETVTENTPGAKLIPLTVKKYSDLLLIFLMKAARPQKYRENTKLEVTGAGGGPIATEHTEKHVVDYDAIETELEKIAGRLATRTPSNGRGEPVHTD